MSQDLEVGENRQAYDAGRIRGHADLCMRPSADYHLSSAAGGRRTARLQPRRGSRTRRIAAYPRRLGWTPSRLNSGRRLPIASAIAPW